MVVEGYALDYMVVKGFTCQRKSTLQTYEPELDKVRKVANWLANDIFTYKSVHVIAINRERAAGQVI